MKTRKTSIGIILFLLIGGLPFLSAFIYAILYSFGLIGIANNGFTTSFWTSTTLLLNFLNSFLYSCAIAVVNMIFSILSALAIVIFFRKQLQSPFYSFVFYMPLAIPSLVVGFLCLQLFSKSGFFARLAFQLQIISNSFEFPDLVNDKLSIGISIAFFSIVMPFFILLFINIYKNERLNEFTQLAQSLGATHFQTLKAVTIPILLKKSKTIIVLYFLFLLGAYEVPLLLGQESPQMLSVLILREMRQYDISYIAAGYVVAVLYTITVLVVITLLYVNKNKAYEY